MVSHEIRNPLSAVLHLAEEVKEVAQELGTTYPDAKDQISDILDAADTILLCVSHQNTLVDDILSFSKLDSMMLSLVPRGETALCFLQTASNPKQRCDPNGNSPAPSKSSIPSLRRKAFSSTTPWIILSTVWKLTTSLQILTE